MSTTNDAKSGNRIRWLAEMPPKLVAQLRGFGLLRCGSIVPDCSAPPIGELRVGKMCRLFCAKHLRMMAEKNGVAMPDVSGN